MSHTYLSNQIREFKKLMMENKLNKKSIMQYNVFTSFVLPVIYMIFLYFAEFNYSFLTIVYLKLLMSGVFSYYLQGQMLDSRELSYTHFYLVKVDQFVNILLMVFILFGIFA